MLREASPCKCEVMLSGLSECEEMSADSIQIQNSVETAKQIHGIDATQIAEAQQTAIYAYSFLGIGGSIYCFVLGYPPLDRHSSLFRLLCSGYFIATVMSLLSADRSTMVNFWRRLAMFINATSLGCVCAFWAWPEPFLVALALCNTMFQIVGALVLLPGQKQAWMTHVAYNTVMAAAGDWFRRSGMLQSFGWIEQVPTLTRRLSLSNETDMKKNEEGSGADDDNWPVQIIIMVSCLVIGSVFLATGGFVYQKRKRTKAKVADIPASPIVPDSQAGSANQDSSKDRCQTCPDEQNGEQKKQDESHQQQQQQQHPAEEEKEDAEEQNPVESQAVQADIELELWLRLVLVLLLFC